MESSFYKKYFEFEKDHWLMRVRRLVVLDALAACGVISNGTILDFGCGSGFFVSKLAERGYDAHGVDISAEAIHYGQVQKIANLSILDSHRLSFEDGSFDAVLMMDVIEHLEDEAWALQEVYRVLKNNGVAVVMVPAYKFLWGVQDEASHHYRRYVLHDLEKVVKRSASFSVVKSTYFNTFLFPPIAAIRLASRWFGVKGRTSDFELNSPFLNSVFLKIFDLERRILRKVKFPFGVSILMVLNKK